MTSLADLPLEITSRIADNIETPDTNALALTCRALQVAAEPYIWEAILLDPYDHGNGTSDVAEDDDPGKVTDDHDGSTLTSLSRNAPSRPDLVGRYSEVFAAFASRPERAKAVKTLILAVLPGAGSYARQLIERTRLTLEDLELEGRHSVDGLGQFENDFAHKELYKAMAGIEPLARLRRLSASFTTDWERQSGFLSRLGPKVSELELIALGGSYEDPESSISTITSASGAESDPEHPEGPALGSLPKLRSLSLRHVDSSCRVFIPTLLEWADKITKLEIRSHRGLSLHEEEDEPMIKALQDHETIEHLVWCTETWQNYAAIPRLFNGKGWDKLRVLETGGGVEMESETYVENIHIPEASHLERLIIPCRTETWYRHVRPPDWGKAPPPKTGLIVNSLIRQLKTCPRLNTVIFSVYERDPEPDPTKWCRKRINGVLIRSYTNGVEEFVHFRRLELSKVNPDLYADYDADELDECNGKDHRWVDHTTYKGCIVLPDVLDKVYKEVGGEGRAWTTPGRGLELPDKAWRLLQRGLGRAKRIIA